MSVWKTVHYRDEPLQWALRSMEPAARDCDFFRSLCDFRVEEFGDFPVPDGIKPGNFRDLFDADPTIASRIDTNDYHPYDRSVSRVLSELPEAISGLSAVYRISAYIIERARDGVKFDQASENKAFTKRLFQYGLAASSHSAKDLDHRLWAIEEACEGAYAKGQDYIKDLLRFRGLHRAKSQKAKASMARSCGTKYPGVEKRGLGNFHNFDVWAIQGGTIFKPKFGGKCIFLLSKDVERVEQLVGGLLLGRVYASFYGALSRRSRGLLMSAMDRVVDLYVDVFKRVNKEDVNKVCRAFDVSYSLYVATFLAKDDPRAKEEQTTKFREEGLDKIISTSEFHRTVSGLPPKEAMEVLLSYKALPQPDYDYFGAAHRQKTMYEENQAAVEEDGAARGDIFDGILDYHKLAMIRAFHLRHKRCPGFVRDGLVHKTWHNVYPHLDPTSLSPEDSLDIDLGGDYIWKERGLDNLDLVKDKAIIPKNVVRLENKRDVRNTRVTDKNYLMDVITRDVPIDCRRSASRLASGLLNLDVRADDKAESHKPDQRWFFELGSEARMVLSIYEDSITDYATYVPGCFSAKSQRDKIRDMNAISKPINPVLPFQVLNINFDIRKFSPYIPARLHQALDRQWAEAFGQPNLLEMYRINTEGQIHYIQGCIHHVFDKLGVDFEGFSGKKLTVYHCAIMGYVVRRLRARNIVTVPGRFAAFVDDGVLRLEVPSDRYVTRKGIILRTIEHIYGRGALRISWDKTYVSSIFVSFLHEVRLCGRSITAGFRAVLKISNRADVPVHSMADDFQVLSGTCFGAIAAGATLFAVYSIYLLKTVEIMRRWSKEKKPFKATEAIRAFFPLNLGGFGLESMVTLSGSLKGPNIPECLSHLELIGYRFPEVRPAVNIALSAEVKHPSKHSSIVNPSVVITTKCRLRSDRFDRLMERSLLNRLNSPVMRALLGATTSNPVSFLEQVLSAGGFVPHPLRELLNDAEKYEVVRKLAKKFLTARSALVLVRFRAMHRVAIKNRTEAQKVTAQYQ